jgi:hypothetical protein
MNEPPKDPAAAHAIALLSHYGFELGGYATEELVARWLETYQASWVRLAVIEALFQGRYKAVSVEQILAVWARRGQPNYRFNHDFERLICRKLPQNLAEFSEETTTHRSQEASLPPQPAWELPPVEDKPSLSQAIAQEETPPAVPNEGDDIAQTPVPPDERLVEVMHQASTTYTADWSRGEGNKQPIDRFTPPPDTSEFYRKLKAVARQQESAIASGVASRMDESEG